jgi:cytochrome c-type biogenesis protein CcmE
VTGVIVIVIVSVLAVVAASTASKTISVAQAASGEFVGTKVQVTGKVVDNSYSLEGNVLSFSIYEDEEATDGGGEASPSTASGGARPQIKVIYDQGVSATFGNQVTAICTGTIDAAGVLVCSKLVTKCPSKYESSVDAFDIAQMLSYGESIVGKPVKVTGTIQAGTLASSLGSGPRFVLTNGAAGDEVPVFFDGGLAEDVTWEGSEVVLTGSIDSGGRFEATVVALKG